MDQRQAMAEAGSDTETPTPDRLHTREEFEMLREEHSHNLDMAWEKVEHLLNNLSALDSSLNLVDLRRLEKNLNREYQDYRKLAVNYIDFLTKKGVFAEHDELEYRLVLNADREIRVQDALGKIDKSIQHGLEAKSPSEVATSRKKSIGSTKSGKTSSSSLSSILRRKHAEAEAARKRFEYAVKETHIRKEQAKIAAEQAELAADLELLTQEKEAAAIEAEVHALQSAYSGSEGSRRLHHYVDVPEEDPNERTKQYVIRHSVSSIQGQSLSQDTDKIKPLQENVQSGKQDTTLLLSNYTPAHSPQKPDLNPYAEPFTPPVERFLKNMADRQTRYMDSQRPPELSITSDFTKFLLKKDLLLSRLTPFNDRPETYAVWKASFQSIMQELQVSYVEELDLLVKWLGPESAKHALSIRSSNAGNPERGCFRIWERMDERYGSPEMVESALQDKLTNFPRLGNKDNKRLYELADILSEIESLKEDPKYRSLLAYYDASSGVRPIVSKLPYNVQEKWTSEALRYKRAYNVSFPPFTFFANFIRQISSAKNDPSFAYDNQPTAASSKNKPASSKSMVAARKTEVESTEPSKFKPGKVDPSKTCPLHKSGHALNRCKGFRIKSLQERKQMLKDFGICFKCCASSEHMARDCKEKVKCTECGSGKHSAALHDSETEQLKYKSSTPSPGYGGEKAAPVLSESSEVMSKCTQICGNRFAGKSCAKTILVLVYPKDMPERAVKMYAILDDQSNSTLATTDFFDKLDVHGEVLPYTLSSCAGNIETAGRRASGFVIEALDHSATLDLPTVIECNHIPNSRDEIPTPDVAQRHSHLNSITSFIPHLDDNAEILLLIGRDLPEAHHVLDQLTGPLNSPYAQRLRLGWVIVGECCLGKVHTPDLINVNKTNVLRNGRPSIFKPCPSEFRVKVKADTLNTKVLSLSKDDQLGDTVFYRTKDDDCVGLSIEDKEFLRIMDTEFKKGKDGKWVVPLPFRPGRPRLPNNLPQTLKRAKTLDISLQRNPVKKTHMLTFMEGIFKQKHAEVAPPLTENQERWYLPIFGVYHPQKPGQIRGVFDSSAQFQGISLNNVLLTGPDMTNNLLGILLRFRKEKVAIMGDIQQMFYCFSVREDHRDFLRFIWYEDNDPTKDLIEYRMCVHVFGNSPSPAVATYGLRLTAKLGEQEFGSDVTEFVNENFYVDDGLTSLPTAEQAISLMKRTQAALSANGNLRLHKIASNKGEVMESFPPEDRAKDLKDINLMSDTLPKQRSLGMIWDLETDTFTYKVSTERKPFTKRGVLSTVNSLYDPIGFISPVIIQGKVFLRDTMSQVSDWDEPLPEDQQAEWDHWIESLKSLEELHISRTYVEASFDQTVEKDIHIFSDASVQAISAVAYLVTTDKKGKRQMGFVLGKSKVAPTHGHTIPRLELCAAVLSVEIADVISRQLEVKPSGIRFYTDSKVVLGYINNQSKRFHVYVANRVDRIRKSSSPEQWTYVPSGLNPADQATRSVPAENIANSTWLTGPPRLLNDGSQEAENYPLIQPEKDTEIRQEVKTLKTVAPPKLTLGSQRFARFSTWKSLVKGVALLKHISRSQQTSGKCHGWHFCTDWRTVELYNSTERLILKEMQREAFNLEFTAINDNQPLPKTSPLRALNPVVDTNGLLRVGGRLSASNLSTKEKNPVIVPSQHHIATLLVRHYHEDVKHQGRHFTEGAVRAAGYWIIGGKKLISSILHKCVTCRKLRGKQEHQKMSDLPPDRLQPSPPFTYVGVDTFGPWTVVARRTRGGQSLNKRWAILFTCLNTRAIHIEVVEDMGASGFINALRRFISIRGKVQEFRSDQGTNFVGSIDDLKIDTVNVEDGQIKDFLYNKGVVWKFNPPHSSHMGGAWERMIGITRRILDSMLTTVSAKNLTHEVLTTFLAEVSAIVNARPIVAVSSDPEAPAILTPSTLLTMKTDHVTERTEKWSMADLYKAQWRRVQALADTFWSRWRNEYLHTLQTRRKWKDTQTNIKEGDVVLLKDKGVNRNQWPTGLVTRVFPGRDGHVRKSMVRVVRNGIPKEYTRPITEMVFLCSLRD